MELIEQFVEMDFEELRSLLAFEQRMIVVYGKEHPQPRLTAWYGPVSYTYSNLQWGARELPSALLKSLQEKVEAHVGCKLPTMLANLYRDGSDRIGWHADDEPLFGDDPVIASLSFGAARDFKMRRKVDHKEKLSFALTDGSLLVMPAGTQREWEHSLPKRARVSEPRINLTFRPLRGA
jgi:alkylated DNA repair dioxygenase AlkB